MELTGAQLIVQKLKEHHVNTVFGYPGGTALELFDAIYAHPDQVKHVLTADECGGAHELHLRGDRHRASGQRDYSSCRRRQTETGQAGRNGNNESRRKGNHRA